ncbi:MAG: hypothetical protein ACOZNI_17560 [Myxococcota bacterium]
MSTDPYGYPETLPPDGSKTLWTAVTAMILTSIGICACYVPYFVAAPLGIWAAIRANAAMAAATDPRDRLLASASLVMGAVSGLISGMFSLFILMYAAFVALYVVVVFAAIGMGIASESGRGGDTGTPLELPGEPPP